MSSVVEKPDLSQYVARVPTAEQYEVWKQLVHDNFAPTLPNEQWHERYGEWRKKRHVQNGRCITWVLVRRDDPDGEIYTILEIQRRDIWVKDKDGIRKDNLYAVTCVITPEHHRRKGYARRLLRTIHYVLAPTIGWPSKAWGEPPILPEGVTIPPAIVSHLSSIAPPGFYEAALIGPDELKREGWVPTQHINGRVTCPLPNNTVATNWKHSWIYRDDFPSLVPGLHDNRLKQLQSAKVDEDEAVIMVDPATPGVLSDHFIDWALMVYLNTRNIPFALHNDIRGVRFYSANQSDPGQWRPTDPLVLFSPQNLEENEIAFHLTANLTPDVVDPLLQALASPELKCQTMQIWGRNADDWLTKELEKRGGKYSSRMEPTAYIPNGLAWYGATNIRPRWDDTEMWCWS